MTCLSQPPKQKSIQNHTVSSVFVVHAVNCILSRKFSLLSLRIGHVFYKVFVYIQLLTSVLFLLHILSPGFFHYNYLHLLPSGLFKDNLQHWLRDFTRLLTGMSNDAPYPERGTPDFN